MALSGIASDAVSYSLYKSYASMINPQLQLQASVKRMRSPVLVVGTSSDRMPNKARFLG